MIEPITGLDDPKWRRIDFGPKRSKVKVMNWNQVSSMLIQAR